MTTAAAGSTAPTTSSSEARSLLAVHAHPDDESIPTGIVLAKHAGAGDRVTLVTCTRGEAGEIVAEDLAELAGDGGERLGQRRVEELAEACALLGVTDHRFLGGPGRWWDSGMMGTPENERPQAFWQADVDEAARELAGVMREVRPQVVITYDDNGAYGHPDHIQAHRVTVAAMTLAADPNADVAGEPWTVRKLYYTAVPRSMLQAAIDAAAAAGTESPFGPDVKSAEDLPFGTPDEIITTAVEGVAHFEAKMAALRAHRSQVAETFVFFAMPEEQARAAFGTEHFTLGHGQLGPVGPDGREHDVFAGL